MPGSQMEGAAPQSSATASLSVHRFRRTALIVVTHHIDFPKLPLFFESLKHRVAYHLLQEVREMVSGKESVSPTRVRNTNTCGVI